MRTGRVFLLWIVGAVLIVPYAIYHLLFHAQPDEYAFLIVVPLFWIFGFWGVVGPLLAVARARKLMRALEVAKDREDLRLAFERNEGEEVIVELMVAEMGIPKWIARRLYGKLAAFFAARLARDADGAPDAAREPASVG